MNSNLLSRRAPVVARANGFVAAAGEFCKSFNAELEKTKPFSAALTEQKLLVAKQFEIAGAGGRKTRLGPLHVVDAARLAALPDAVVVDWHRRGRLAAVHAHLLSLNNWAGLVVRKAAP